MLINKKPCCKACRIFSGVWISDQKEFALKKKKSIDKLQVAQYLDHTELKIKKNGIFSNLIQNTFMQDSNFSSSEVYISMEMRNLLQTGVVNQSVIFAELLNILWKQLIRLECEIRNSCKQHREEILHLNNDLSFLGFFVPRCINLRTTPRLLSQHTFYSMDSY